MSTIDNIIYSLDIISHFNPNMRTLHDSFVEQSPLIAGNIPIIENAAANSVPIYDTLIVHQVGLANAVHDYVYNIIHPLDSAITKNVVREQICRDLFGLVATY